MKTILPTILIVEDDAGLAELLQESIQISGYQTICVHTATNALNWLAVNQPTLMLLDYSLPDMNGKEFIMSLKEKSAIVPPFILTTGRGDERTAVDMMKLGARDYIIKDTHFLELIPLVVSKICNDIQNENSLKKVEQALLKNQFLLEESQRITSTGTWELNLETNRLTWSDEIFGIFEVDKSKFDATYEAFLAAIHPDDRKMVDKAYSSSLKTKKPYLIEHRLLMTDGRIKYVTEQCETTFDAEDKPLISIGVVQDITKRKLVELAFEKSREEFKDLYDNAPIGYHEIDMEGRILRMNKTELNMLGYSINEISGKYIWELTSDSKFSKEQTLKKLQNKHKNSFPYERDFLCNDGTKLPVLVKDRQILSETGEIIGSRSSVQDISEIRNINIALRDKEVQYRAIADNGMALIWTAETDKRCNYFNQPWLEFTGRKLEQEIGNGWKEGIHPEDFDRCMETYVAAFDKRERFNMEYRLRHNSGEYRWLVDMGTPNYNSSGEFIGYIGHCFDIHDKRKAQDEVISLGKHYQTIIEKSPSGIVLLNLELHFTYASPSAMKMFGYTENDFTAITPDEITHPDDLALVLPSLNRLMEDPDYVPVLEYRFRHKDGHYLWIESTFSNMFSDPAVQSIVINFKDITERKQAELALVTSENKYRSIYENSTLAILLTSPEEGKILSANGAACQLFRATEEELCSSERYKFVDQNDPRFEQLLKQRGKTGKAKGEARLRKKDGSTFDGLISAAVFFDKDGKLNSSMIIADLTYQKQAEDSLRESEAKFKSVFQNSIVGKSITTLDGKMLPNKAYADMLGYSVEELSELYWPEITHKDDVERNAKITRSILNGEKPSEQWEKRYIHKNGNIVWVEISSSLLRDSNGEPLYSICEINDITARKLAEESLRKSEETYRNLVTRMPDGVYKSSADGRFIDVNPAMVRLLGYDSKEELLSISIKNDLYFDLSDRNKELNNHQEGIISVFRLRKKDGSEIWVEDHGWYTYDENGVIKIHEGVIRDITARKLAEDKLISSHSLLNATLESTADGILVVDCEGKATIYNKKFAEMWRIPTELLEVGIDEQMLRYVLTQLDNPTEFINKVNELYRNPEMSSIEEIVLSDGRIFERYSIPQRVNDEIVGRVWSFRDETERIRIDKALKKNSEVLNSLLELSIELLNANPNSADYNSLMNRIIQISGAKFCSFNLFEDNSNDFRTVAYSGLENALNYAKKLLGYDFRDKKWKHDTIRAAKIKNQTTTKFNSLSELIGDSMPHSIVKLIEKTYNLGQTYVVKINNNKVQYGDFTLLFERNTTIKNTQFVELLANIVGTYIERIKSENALRLSESNLSEALVISNLGFWEYSALTDTFIFNDQFYTIYNTTAEMQGGYSMPSSEYVKRFVYPDDIKAVELEVAKMIGTTDSNYRSKIDHRVICGDGAIKHISVNVRVDEVKNGVLVRSVGANQDITARKNAEILLTKSERFFRQSQKAAKIGSYSMNFKTGQWESSEVLDEIFGIDKDYNRDVSGWLDLVADNDRDMMELYLQDHVIGRKKPFDKEYSAKRKSDGTTTWVLGLGELLFEGDEMVSMVGTIQNIDERKKAEVDLHEKMEELMRFHRLTVDRELSMIELKKEINALLKATGKEEKYRIIE
jgi:PAS domain S-box-containing protein